MQAARGRTCACELFGEVECEHHQGDLAMAVGAHTIVAPLEHWSSKSNGLCAPTSRLRGVREPIGPAAVAAGGQQVRREVVNGEAQLVAILTQRAGRLTSRTRLDPGAVYKHVQAVVVDSGLRRPAGAPGQVRRVGQEVVQPIVARLLANLAHRVVEALAVAAVQEYGSSVQGQISTEEPSSDEIFRWSW